MRAVWGSVFIFVVVVVVVVNRPHGNYCMSLQQQQQQRFRYVFWPQHDVVGANDVVVRIAKFHYPSSNWDFVSHSHFLRRKKIAFFVEIPKHGAKTGSAGDSFNCLFFVLTMEKWQQQKLSQDQLSQEWRGFQAGHLHVLPSLMVEPSRQSYKGNLILKN